MDLPQVQNLEYVEPGDFKADDMRWLEQAEFAGPAYDKIPMLRIEHALRTGIMHLFRFTPGEGVLLTEVVSGASGIKRLCIVRAAGRGVGWYMPSLIALLAATAHEWGCEGVEAVVYSGKIAQMLQKVGAKPEALRMFLPVTGE